MGLQKASRKDGEGNSTSTDATAMDSNVTMEVEAAWYARRSTATLTCSHWDWSRGTCAGTWSGRDAHLSASSCNACGFFASPRYAAWALAILDGQCHGSFSQGGGHGQRTCIGRCPGGGEYSCSASETAGTSVHLTCSSTCTPGTLP